MIKAVIIEDEKHCIEMLTWELKNLPYSVDIIASFQDPIKGLKFIKENTFDILFLDIEMPRMTGLQLITNLSNINFEIIFTTAFDQFAIKAIKLSALDYLLKPINSNDLSESLDKYKSKQLKEKRSDQYNLLINQIKNPQKKQDRIAINTHDGVELITIEEIKYLKADSNYSTIYFNDKKLLVSKTLKHFEMSLEDYSFIRLHHSYFVNFKHIVRFHKADGGQVELYDGTLIPVSRRKREDLIKVLESIQ